MSVVARATWVVCYDEQCGFVCELLSYFMLVPHWVFVISHVVALIDNDQYFCIASYLLLGLAYFYSNVMAPYIGIERPAPYSNAEHGCTGTDFVVPDPTFVASMSYVLAFCYGIVYDVQRRRRFFEKHKLLTLAGLLGCVLYMTATLTSRYFLPWHLLVNTFVAFLTATLFVFVYWAITGSVRGPRARNLLEKFFDTDRTLFTRPLRIRERVGT